MTDAVAADALDRLWDEVAREPWAWDFYALLRRVDAMDRARPLLGSAPRPRFEPMRLAQEPELDFAPSAISSLRRTDGRPPRVGVRFFGLFGPNGPMPLHFTEHVRDRAHQHGDTTTLRFLDLFHHRLLLLLYRAWAQSQPAVQHDRPRDDRFAVWLGACAGLGTGRADEPRHRAALHLAGLLAQRTRHPEGLRQLLRQVLDVPVELEPHVGQWLAIAPEDQSALGFAANRAERLQRPAPRLGMTATIGNKVWDRQYRFRLVIGPLSAARYEDLLPGGADWDELNHWVRRYVGHDLSWDVVLCLDGDALEPLRLGTGRHALGRTSWIAGRRPDAEPATREPAHDFERRAALARAGHRVDLRLMPDARVPPTVPPVAAAAAHMPP